MKKSWGLQGHKNITDRSCWGTPWELFKFVEYKLGVSFSLDAAADENNRKCLDWYDVDSCGLSNPWHTWTWCNPPYTMTADFVKKAASEKRRGISSVVMTYAACDVAWFHDFFDDISEIIFIKGRVKSIDPNTGIQSKKDPAKGHMLMVFDSSIESDHVVCSTLDYKGNNR